MNNLKNLSKKELLFKISNLIVELLLIIFGFIGLYINLSSNSGFMAGIKVMFTYFTIQSNVTIILITLIIFILRLIELFTNKKLVKNYLLVIKFIFTIAISVTFFVFSLMLAPSQEVSYLLSMSNLTVHAIVPLLAIIDYFVFDKDIKFNKFIPLTGTLMPLYYLIFVYGICLPLGITFGGNLKFPYFFLDYETLTWFNITSNGVGVFYYILILLFAIIGLSYLYAFLNNLFHHKKFVSFKRKEEVKE